MIDLNKMEKKFEEILQTENAETFKKWQKQQEVKRYKKFVGEGEIEFFQARFSHFKSETIDVEHIFTESVKVSNLDYDLAA